MTHDEMIVVIAHHKNGGKVEYKRKDEAVWKEVINKTGPAWDFDLCDYRAKPEPLVLWFLRTEDGERYGTYYSRDEAEEVKRVYDKNHVKNLTIKKFVEVEE
jgi:hypothetical protein